MTTYQIVSTRKRKTVRISRPEDAWELLKKYVKEEREHLIVLTLNSAHEVISTSIVSIGLVNKTIVHPREVFRKAIADNAVCIIVAHNHPSGNSEPSDEDEEIFHRLKEVGEIIGIRLLDFVVFTRSGCLSFAKRENE
jgi:DNA repair protein RadC